MLGKSYDAILMDIQIPGMDGIETAMKIRQQGFDPQTTPIIAITAPPAEEVRRKCRCSLFNECIQKPIDIQQLQKNRNSNNSTRLNVITQPPRLNTTNYCRPIHTKLVLAV